MINTMSIVQDAKLRRAFDLITCSHTFILDHHLRGPSTISTAFPSKRMETTTGRDYDTQLSQRYQTLIWFCLDCDLARTAVFYAERYFSIHQIHASRHLYALSLLRLGQTYPALALVTMPEAKTCSGCLELKAKCCTALGRFRQAAEALNDAMQHSSYNANGA